MAIHSFRMRMLMILQQTDFIRENTITLEMVENMRRCLPAVQTHPTNECKENIMAGGLAICQFGIFHQFRLIRERL